MENSQFVVMEHHAKRAGIHWDIRFRVPGKKDWDSFASRKEPPTKSGEKRMISRTTWHSEEEALYTGKIESGYGAGELIQWDIGNCDIMKYKPNHIVINFHGKRLHGIYHFISRISIGIGDIGKSEKDKTYLFFKGKMV